MRAYESAVSEEAKRIGFSDDFWSDQEPRTEEYDTAWADLRGVGTAIAMNTAIAMRVLDEADRREAAGQLWAVMPLWLAAAALATEVLKYLRSIRIVSSERTPTPSKRLASSRAGNMMLLRLGKVMFLVFNLGPTVSAIVIFRTLQEMTMWWISLGFGLIHWWIVGVYDNFRRHAMAERLSRVHESMPPEAFDPKSDAMQDGYNRAFAALGPFDNWMPTWITTLTNLAWLVGAGLLTTSIVMWVF